MPVTNRYVSFNNTSQYLYYNYDRFFSGENFPIFNTTNTKVGIKNSAKFKRIHCRPNVSFGVILKPILINIGQAIKRLPNTKVEILNKEPIKLNKGSTLFILYIITAQVIVMTIVYTIGGALKVILVI